MDLCADPFDGEGCRHATPRLLIVPGLRDSGDAHWQTWLQRMHRHAVRVVQDDWETPDLTRWSERIARTLDRSGPGPWLVAAHSFGVLALAHHLGRGADERLAAALLVAPADPRKFGVQDQLPHDRLPLQATLVGSQTDPWMPVDQAGQWARRWGAHFVNLGDAGHVNAESGHGPLPLARRWVMATGQHLVAARRSRWAAGPLAISS
jgi:predicted alpha/beta hydrolase family esterase